MSILYSLESNYFSHKINMLFIYQQNVTLNLIFQNLVTEYVLIVVSITTVLQYLRSVCDTLQVCQF